ncbi:uncharacterized protein KZ484_003141 [Pholidichthys leucotaenia]
MVGQSLGLSCSPQRSHGSPSGLHLYYRGTQGQITLLSVGESGEVKVDPDHRGRLQLHGGLSSLQVNVTISDLQQRDAGLYLWELIYREENGSDQLLTAQRVFLLVEGTGGSCLCSQSYPLLLWTIVVAAGLLLLMLSWLAIDKCVKRKPHHRLQPHTPIYEEMSRKQQQCGRAASAQKPHKASSHLEEVHFPVYANPNIRQQQDNYYACPRQLALRA